MKVIENAALERLASWEIPDAEQEVSVRNSMLYALSVGLGREPVHAGHLRFVSENQTEMVPSMVLSVAAPGFWFKNPELGIDWAKLLNVTQSFEVSHLPPLPAKFRSRSRVLEIVDKGAGRGAIVSWERRLWADTESEPCAIVTSTVLLRGDGRAQDAILKGNVRHVSEPAPARAPDRVVELPTNPNSGLLYRLNGTLNPLHADPAIAAAAGFPRPIMPGTASIGFITTVLLEEICDFNPACLSALGARLTAPLFPGDLLRCELWVEGDNVWFRVVDDTTAKTVLDAGHARIGKGRKLASALRKEPT